MAQALAPGQSKAASVLEEEGSRAKRGIPIKVSHAFHLALMTPLADCLGAHPTEHTVSQTNISDSLERGGCIRYDWRRGKTLARHAARLSCSLERLGWDHGGGWSRSLMEIWATKVLSGLNRRISEGIPCIALREPEHYDGLEA